ncbi:PREDICTED: EF-hand and coiled-coil domain-containing protein 1 [Nanorana parkeri]|uniref:EF-hand and coiled-coil domain-containing protein 1 n=1 Tax=Nanorana parkeri TaxID=125878 RepID=UPI000854C959|nr:PREDICTED: EF-hand and coiled-coil domain-containing protein 1 [Nanorana parkeri]
MDPADLPYHPPRPARRTQWLASVLAHHYGLDRGLDNEIIVLASGLDQYLQEVFHHLDWRAEGTISGEEFRTLCGVLGLEPGMDECEGLLEQLPERLTFRHFHARLCGHFSSKARGPRLPVSQGSPIRLRRKKSPRMTLTGEDDVLHRLEDENRNLRELLEDMRTALQSSDARCLALQVGLRRNLASQKDEGISTVSNRRVLSQSYTVTTRCVQREVNLIQSSRDEQLEEVIKMNKDLEEELSKTQSTLIYLEECNQRLIREQAETRKRAEDARQALLACYGKVKDLEEKSSEAPLLQIRVDQLQTELQQYRSERMVSLMTQEEKILAMRSPLLVRKTENLSPTEVDDQLFRSVEGQAASDEEEERWIGETAAEVRQILTNVSCCASGCEDRGMRKLLCDIRSDGINHKNMLFLLVKKVARMMEELAIKEQEMKDMEVLMEEMKGSFIEELEGKAEENELLRIDLQMLETERVRLSLIEEKLLDVLQLLQQLRDLEISHQELGRVLLNTLEMCREPQQGKEHIYEVLDTLRHELSVCELHQSQQKNKDNKAPSLTNSLVISC